MQKITKTRIFRSKITSGTVVIALLICTSIQASESSASYLLRLDFCCDSEMVNRIPSINLPLKINPARSSCTLHKLGSFSRSSATCSTWRRTRASKKASLVCRSHRECEAERSLVCWRTKSCNSWYGINADIHKTYCTSGRFATACSYQASKPNLQEEHPFCTHQWKCYSKK